MEKKITPQERWANKNKDDIKVIGFKLFLNKEEDREVLDFFDNADKSRIDTLKEVVKFYKEHKK